MNWNVDYPVKETIYIYECKLCKTDVKSKAIIQCDICKRRLCGECNNAGFCKECYEKLSLENKEKFEMLKGELDIKSELPQYYLKILL